jgi:putative nucleotidyltransferase with HDIG domain
MTTPRVQLADDLVRRLAAAMRAAQLYSSGHPIIGRNLAALGSSVDAMHRIEPSTVIGVVGDELIFGDTPLARAEALAPMVRRLQQSGVERVTIDRGVTSDELSTFIGAVITIEASDATARHVPFPALPHVRVGRVAVEQRVEGNLNDIATIKRLYNDAVNVAGRIWDCATTEGRPDTPMARTVVDGLAQAVAENRTALVALTALKDYDNYTFTHMVNVSILTMAQARGLGVDGPLLREFGLAALMHDIGKVRTPLDILNKPTALTPAEFAIMKRHTVDGAEMLRRTPDVPTLAPVVAFEHHLRLDGSGYPEGVSRGSLNLGTVLCSIADVYDAMRSQRHYQRAFPTDRILEVLRSNDGRRFDPHLVRRFVQLLGIYPPGNLVRLDTGEAAVVLAVHAPDPHRPRVRVVLDAAGQRLKLPYDVNLWERGDRTSGQRQVAAPLDPADFQLDPLLLM